MTAGRITCNQTTYHVPRTVFLPPRAIIMHTIGVCGTFDWMAARIINILAALLLLHFTYSLHLHTSCHHHLRLTQTARASIPP